MLSTNSNLPPQPLVFAPSQSWDGNDGKWSSFVVRVGTPEQNFRVLPASSTGELIIPHPQGCTANVSDPPDCGAQRGVFDFDDHPSPGFQTNASSTWDSIGIYGLELETQLGYDANVSYGLDNIGLMIQHAGGPTLSEQVVGTIANKRFFIGLFGLSPKPANFSDYNYPQRSYMSGLKDDKFIPSLSYGYTAGAYYKSPKALGSLTLGGYDESRFLPNNITFPFDGDDSRSTSLKLQRISADRTSHGNVSLLDDEIYVHLDFTVPHLWLPPDICERFASVFGLQHDEATDLYLTDPAIHDSLLKQNPAITFALGLSSDPADRVNIVLPYSAFDLQASYPTFPKETNYFPIRRGNETQYTLGRAFLQEAYVIVDYERSQFSVHQAQFPASSEQKIVPIYDKDYVPKPPTPAHKGGLEAGAIAGIAIGSAALIALLVVAFVICRRRKQARKKQAAAHELAVSIADSQTAELPEDEKAEHRVADVERLELQSLVGSELGGVPRVELESSPVELPAESVHLNEKKVKP